MRSWQVKLAALLLCLSALCSAQTINGVPVLFGAAFPQVANSNSLATKSSGNVASLGLAFTNNNTKGNTIIAVCGVGNSVPLTASDTAGNTYTNVASGANSSTFSAQILMASNIAAGANTVTCSNGGSNSSMAIQIYEFSGLLTVTTAGKTASFDTSNSGSATSANLSSGSITTFAPNEILIAGFAVGTAAQTITVTSPFVNDSGQQNPTTPSGLFSFAAASYYSPAVEIRQAQATVTSEPWAAVIASFKTAIVPIGGTVDARQSGIYNVRNQDGSGNSLTSTSNALDVNLKSGAIPSGSNSIGTVQPGNTANTTPWLAAPAAEATTTNSALTSYLAVAASTNATSVKGSAGNVYGYSAINTTGTIYYLRMYNLSTSPTCSSSTGFVESIPIPANTTGAGLERWPHVPQGFTTGIAYCVTGGSGNTDNTNAATGVFLTILYK
jgi:hypothetical protein